MPNDDQQTGESNHNPPEWLAPLSQWEKFKDFVKHIAIALLFPVFTVVCVLLIHDMAESLLGNTHVNPIFSITFDASPSPYLIGDISASVVMLVYFGVVFYYEKNREDGAFTKDAKTLTTFVIILYIFGIYSLIQSAISGAIFTFQKDGEAEIQEQLRYLLMFALSILFAELLLKFFHPNPKTRFRFELFVKFVDFPMTVGFFMLLALTYFAPVFAEANFAIFASGAIAFQIIVFNVVYVTLDRLPNQITATPKAILVHPEGDFSENFHDFATSWNIPEDEN